MSKSIYEEALEIIDKNTFELGKGLDVLKPTYREAVVKALEQAQKEHELLELYKKHYKLVPFKPGLGDNAKTVIDIQKQIKELENE